MIVEYTARNHAIAAYLVHGHTPWGHPLSDPGEARLIDCGGEWIMCCGHVLTDAEARAWVEAGIAKIDEPRGADARRRLLAVSPEIGMWMNDCWDVVGGDYQYPKGEAA